MPSVGSADPRLLSSQPNEPCSGVRGQGRRLTRRSSWTDLRPVTERAASPAVRRCSSVGTVPVRRATPFSTSTSILASLSSGRPASAFFTARSTDASCAFTASCFDGATTRSWFTCICYMALYALQDSVEQRGVAGGGARGRSGQLLVGALGKGGSGRCPAPTGWSVGLPLWTSDSATNLPTVAPAPTACGYGLLAEQVPCQTRCGAVGPDFAR